MIRYKELQIVISLQKCLCCWGVCGCLANKCGKY